MTDKSYGIFVAPLPQNKEPKHVCTKPDIKNLSPGTLWLCECAKLYRLDFALNFSGSSSFSWRKTIWFQQWKYLQRYTWSLFVISCPSFILSILGVYFISHWFMVGVMCSIVGTVSAFNLYYDGFVVKYIDSLKTIKTDT